MNEIKVSTNKKYVSNNPISRLLINNFNKSIEKLINNLRTDNLILDIGSGEGIIYSKLKLQKEIFLLDINLKELMCAKHNMPHTIMIQGNILNLPYKSDSSDLVTCFEVLEHIPDYFKAISEIIRISKKYCIISIPNEPLWRLLNIVRGVYWKKLGNTPGHINHWNEKRIKTLLFQYPDIRIEKIYKPIPWLIILIKIVK